MSYPEFFAANALALPLLTLLLGLLVGSFLNVVIYRLPLMLQREWREQCQEFLALEDPPVPAPHFVLFNLSRPGSHCPQCRHALSAGENIPVLSWLLQRGKCRHCTAPISPRYPLLEIATALLSCLIASRFGFSWLTLALLPFTWTLIVLAMIDFDHQLLPDDLTLPLLWGGLLVNTQGWLSTLESAVWGAIAGYLALWTIYWLFKLLTGREGMGYGDFKLLAALGAWLGWQALPQIILLSSLVGAVTGIALMLAKGHARDMPIPFGPFLAGAGLLALLLGPDLTLLFFGWLS